MLLLARKHGMVYFRGEMLLQTRDDTQPIVLLKSSHEARALFDASSFQWGSLTWRERGKSV
jgi:hypothetical protein